MKKQEYPKFDLSGFRHFTWSNYWKELKQAMDITKAQNEQAESARRENANGDYYYVQPI